MKPYPGVSSMMCSVHVGATNSRVFPPLLLMMSGLPSPVKSAATAVFVRSPSNTTCFLQGLSAASTETAEVTMSAKIVVDFSV
jgi:hypothetical protein